MDWDEILGGIALIALFAFIFFSNKSDAWIGFYTSYNDNGIYKTDQFKTRDECERWLRNRQSESEENPGPYTDFECGKNCKLSDGEKIYVCKETFD